MSIHNTIFLLTSSDSKHSGIGSIFLNDILSGITDHKINWFVEPPYLLKVGIFGKGILGKIFNSTLVRIKFWQNLRIFIFLKIKLTSRIKKIEGEFHASGAKTIWATTSSPEIICIAHKLADRGHDVRVTIWDTPEYLLQNLGLSKKNCIRISKHFECLMSKASAASVISDSMLETYSERFPRLPINIMRHGIAQKARLRNLESNRPIRFVFSGSLYSKNEWNAFVNALEKANWYICGREIKLTFIGNFPLKGAIYPTRMEHYSTMSQESAMNIMAQMDIGYLPYWLSPDKEFVARTSFPGKMTAYSAAGLSVFHHGPSSSSVTKFLATYPYGVACDSLDPNIVLLKLEYLIQNTMSKEHMQALQNAMNDMLSDKAMIAAFRKLIAPLPDLPKLVNRT